MSVQVRITHRAEQDIRQIRDWMRDYSTTGARHWLSALEEAVAQLSQTALSAPLADEANDLQDVDLRQRTFKTRRGRRYRLVFVVRDQTVYLLGVRAGGQDWLRPDEIQFPELMP